MPRFTANLSLLFTELPLLQRFAAARRNGFEAVEIQFPYELSVEQIAKALAENELRLVLFNVAAADLLDGGEGLAAVPELRQCFRQALGQCLSYAEILRPEVINVLPGRCLDGRRLSEYRQTLIDNLRLAADSLAEIGVTTLFEAVNSHDMPGFIVDSSADMLEILDAVNHPNLRLQYDIYHMTRMGEDCVAFLNHHLEKIGHIQFADCPGRGQPGTGTVNFAELFSLLDRLGYQGWVGAEYRPQGQSEASLGWLRD